MNLEQTVSTQRVRIEELEEELRQMRESLAPPAITFPMHWKLTPAQRRLLSAFIKTPFLTHEQCAVALALNPVIDPDGLVKVQISKARRKIERMGLQIINRWGEGYEMPKESVEKLRAAVT